MAIEKYKVERSNQKVKFYTEVCQHHEAWSFQHNEAYQNQQEEVKPEKATMKKNKETSISSWPNQE